MRWLAIGLALALTGCSDLQIKYLDKDWEVLHGQPTFRPCLDPTVVCIHP
jgi:hypothetical protein